MHLRTNLLPAILLLTLTTTLSAQSQEKGIWRASSKNAKSVTGDIAFSEYKVAIDFYSFTIANIRNLTPAELAAAFDSDTTRPGATGTLYRMVIPGTRKFLHGTTLCGAEDTQWIVTYVNGRNLQLLFFSGSGTPVLTPEGLADNPDLCGLYTYTR
jgi:hypothetical protein